MNNTLFVFRGITQKRILNKVHEKGPYDFLYGYDQFSETKVIELLETGVMIF